MRVAIVNDLASETEILRRAIEATGAHQVCWTAANGAEAVRSCSIDLPELILLDVQMPGMDGAQTTCAIMRQSPCAILLVAAPASAAEAKVFEAMGCGALDVAAAPALDASGHLRDAGDLLRKIGAIARLVGPETPKPVAVPGKKIASDTPPLVAIGASTGGPKALATVLRALPASLQAAVVIVQHLDQQFAVGLAEWLAGQSPAPVRVVRDGEPPQPGVVLVAATNDHLELSPRLGLRYTSEPADYPYRPSVDTFFLSVAKHWPRRDVAVLLTGMGRDGARGLLALKQAGWHTIAQDEATSTVYGMPKAAAELGAALEVLPLDRIGATTMRRIGR